MYKFSSGLVFSLGLLLAVTLLLVGLVPVYNLIQTWAGVEETSGHDRSFLEEANRAMRDYLYGYREDLLIEREGRSLFGSQEVFHMAEVRLLFTWLARAALALFILAFFLSYLGGTRLFRDQILGFLTLILILPLMGLFFDRAFVLLHKILFDNDLWLFPWDSQLIIILPQKFFYYFTLLIIACYSLASLLIYLIERIYYDFTSRSR